jgi:hypothetical protein
MNKADIETLVQHWLDTALDEAPTEWTPHREDDLMTHHDSLLESLISDRVYRMAPDADDLLKSAGLPAMDHESLVFKQLCRRLLEAHLEYTRLQQDQFTVGDTSTNRFFDIRLAFTRMQNCLPCSVQIDSDNSESLGQIGTGCASSASSQVVGERKRLNFI